MDSLNVSQPSEENRIMINPSVQKYSRDGYLRLTTLTLYRTKFTHLYSEPLPIQEAAIGTTLCGGTTEWSCDMDGETLSLSWDWRRIDDGAIVMDGTHGLRSNMMMTCEKGYDLGDEHTDALLTEHIARLHWQAEVVKALRALKPGARSNFGCDPRLLRSPLL